MSIRGLNFLGDANVISVNPVMFELCKSIHMGNSMAAACRRKLFDDIFESGPEFYWNSKPILPRHEFVQLVKKHWIQFCKDAMDWIMIAGIVPIAFEKLPDKNMVPIVPSGRLKEDFDIQMVNKGGRASFVFIKLRSRKNGARITPRVDKKVFVRSGFGWDPNDQGLLTSIVASIIRPDYVLNMITQYMLRAEYNRSDPEIVTETSNETMGTNNEEGGYGFYGDWDKVKYKDEARYRLNNQEILAAIQQQQTLQEYAPTPELNSMGEPIIDKFKKQSADNLHPLPVNHKLVRQNMPESRTDWVAMNRHNENVICAAYLVPRAYLIADEGMSETSVKLTQATYAKTVNGWKTRLSDLLTDVYNFIYREEDCKTAMCTYTRVELDSMSEEELFNKSNDPRVHVGFSQVPVDTDDGLLRKYALGLLDWPNFRQMSLLTGGYPQHLINQTGKEEKKGDPWNQQYKLSVLRSADAEALAKLGAMGTVVFPPAQPVSQTTDGAGQTPAPSKKTKKKDQTDNNNEDRQTRDDADDESAKRKKKKQKTEK